MRTNIHAFGFGIGIGLACVALGNDALAAGVAPDVIANGNGFKKLHINDPSYRQLFEQTRSKAPSAQALSKASAPPAASTSQVIQLTTLRGVKEAGVPTWLQREFLDAAGYASWSAVPAAVLDSKMAPVTVDVDALDEVTRGLLPTPPAAGGTVRTESFLGGLIDAIQDCTHKKVTSEAKSFSKDFSQQTPNLGGKIGQASEFDVNGVFGGKGTFAADIHYLVSSRCGVPYSAQLDYADLTVDGELNGTTGVTGRASVSYKGNLLPPKHFDLLQYDYEWWAYIFEFEVDLKLGVDFGVKVDAEASASVAANYSAEGSIGLTWRCTTSDCTKTRSQSDLDFKLGDGSSREAEAKIQVIPYVDTNFAAELGMYGGVLTLATGKVGIVAALPVSYFAYSGNTCSDADGDGTQETVRASLLDVDAELYAYVQADIAGKKIARTVDLDLLGFDDPVNGPLYHADNLTGTKYRKNLFHKDFLRGGSSVAQPVAGLPKSVNLNGGITLGNRTCYPYTDAVTYEVDWGDSTPHAVGPGGLVKHTWSKAGKYAVATRILSDAAGRKLAGPWLRLATQASASGTIPGASTPAKPAATAQAALGTAAGITGYVWSTAVADTVPLYHYVNQDNGDHVYTTNFAELGAGEGAWTGDGITGYVLPVPTAGYVALYRYVNRDNGDHRYTTNSAEVAADGGAWTAEGIAGYVLPPPPSGPTEAAPKLPPAPACGGATGRQCL